jgi:large subunit ribosomal protein L1
LGKVSFDVDQLYENLAALTAEIQRARPAGSKGRYIKGITVSSTMGPGIKVDPVRLEEMAKAV